MCARSNYRCRHREIAFVLPVSLFSFPLPFLVLDPLFFSRSFLRSNCSENDKRGCSTVSRNEQEINTILKYFIYLFIFVKIQQNALSKMEQQNQETQQNTIKKKEIGKAEDKPNQPTRVWKSWKFPAKAGGFQIVGFSRAADRTFFHIPDMKISLDAGHCRGRQPDTVIHPPPLFFFLFVFVCFVFVLCSLSIETFFY